MTKRYFTIGMAGHIDHGKTTLTKALTNVDTDRLKEEKERQISIELGFAPLHEDGEIQISVIDVPGHERFIRQMIAGVAGIDLVVLVVAADEGVMPQTKEHLEILDFLGIQNGIVAITKMDRVDSEFIDLVKEEVMEELQGTVFESVPFVLTDSLSGKGIEELKNLIIHILKEQDTRDAKGAFRLPIDQVFTVKGQGTVVRGTVYEGKIEEGQALKVLPAGLDVKARQIQVHHQPSPSAFAGQRAAINLSGVSKEDLERGEVLVSSEHFSVTKTIDVALRIVDDLEHPIKQRMPVKCHIGTAEVMGRIVFFDRNELKDTSGEILCQLRLDEEIVTKRGDRFILRRPSPVETIGGGWVIDPNGDKYRFGLQTIEDLTKKKEGSPKDRIIAALAEDKSLALPEIMAKTSLDEQTASEVLTASDFLQINSKDFILASQQKSLEQEIYGYLHEFHHENSLKQGLNKAELLQVMQRVYPKALIEYVINLGIENGIFRRKGQFLHNADFNPHAPKSWQKRTENLLADLKKDGLKVKNFDDYYQSAGIPDHLKVDLKRFLEDQGAISPLDGQFYWHGDYFRDAVEKLKRGTGSDFEVGDAKEILGLSRKYMIPFLERLDSIGLTNRVENKRVWR
ncbi:selenocysteine-specific translation elongation factor [Cytobacillus sp. NCCP-133]|uniref:selenocysteine-specific translation elongation factor n=1 Tax=Cytobacillus sp. NCCP-133 TaxID=766848 RepID=UPI002232C1A0|nr:selenocysteine-specific translation elongation factor [Cytobacillus sp. NCCP-133]GLB60870.1 selenocysteine-specific translation elongation factor [Cytobacillus sp. NCCP-133]